MKRLTDKYWRNFDPWECCGQDNFCQRGCHDCALHELNAYKDLGSIDHIRDLLHAEKDGRLVVLPWAVGEIIYEADPEHGVVKHTLVDASWCMHSKAEDCEGKAWYDFWDAEDTAYKTSDEAEEALAGKGGAKADKDV